MSMNRRQTLLAAAAATLFPMSRAHAAFAWPRNFSVITPVVGTANHSLAVAWTSKFQAATGVRAAVLPQVQRGFFAVDLKEVRAAVSALPWVEKVEVRKRWPDKPGSA